MTKMEMLKGIIQKSLKNLEGLPIDGITLEMAQMALRSALEDAVKLGVITEKFMRESAPQVKAVGNKLTVAFRKKK